MLPIGINAQPTGAQIRSGDIVDVNIMVYLSEENLISDQLAIELGEFSDKDFRILVNFTRVPSDIQSKFSEPNFPVGTVTQSISNVLMSTKIGETKNIKVDADEMFSIPEEIKDVDTFYLKITTIRLIYSPHAKTETQLATSILFFFFIFAGGSFTIFLIHRRFIITLKNRRTKKRKNKQTRMKRRIGKKVL